MKRTITPVEFAALITSAQHHRTLGKSTFESARAACLEFGTSDAWAAPLLAFLNDSPVAAEAWAKRMFDEALVAAHARCEAREVAELRDNLEPYPDDMHLRSF